MPATPEQHSVVPFDFDGAPVRAVSIDGEAYLVGKDVAERLGYADPTNAMKKHCKGVVKRHPLQTPGGVQEVRVLAEPDVLRLIIGSKLPAAEKFERWVFEEVLPAIRKTGGYMIAAPDETAEELALRAMKVLQATVDRQKAQLADALPKANALDRIASADGCLGLQEAAKALQVRPNALREYMICNDWLYRRAGSGNLLGYQHRVTSGYLTHKVHTILQPDGSEKVCEQVKITARGLTKLAKIVPGANAAQPS